MQVSGTAAVGLGVADGPICVVCAGVPGEWTLLEEHNSSNAPPSLMHMCMHVCTCHMRTYACARVVSRRGHQTR
eukprot:366239-Chlamydomonas_euryale.AAC.35